MPPVPLSVQQWKEFASESAGKFQPVKFAGPLPVEGGFAQQPLQFKAPPDLGAGCGPEQLRPASK